MDINNKLFEITPMREMFNVPNTMMNNHMHTMSKMMNKMLDTSHEFMDQGFVEIEGNYVYEIPISKELIKNIKINEKKGIITISGKIKINKINNNNQNENETCTSRSTSTSTSTSIQSIYKSISLPKNAVENTAIASYNDGILKLVAEKQK